MAENLAIYNRLRAVPESAKKQIHGGRLKGMTDINPMHRIKQLTEEFGMCGAGWVVEDVRHEFVPGADGEIAVFVSLNLRVRIGDTGEMSAPIPGCGGAMYIAMERGALHTNDEAIKMATTDAMSVACKMLGSCADVYWEKDSIRTKYSDTAAEVPTPKPQAAPKPAPVPKPQAAPKPAPVQSAERLASPEQLAELKWLISEERVPGMLASYHVHATDELTFDQAAYIIRIERRKQNI